MTVFYERITIAVIYMHVQIQRDLYIKLCHAVMQDMVMRLTDNITFYVSAEYAGQISNEKNDPFEFVSNLYHRIKKCHWFNNFKMLHITFLSEAFMMGMKHTIKRN